MTTVSIEFLLQVSQPVPQLTLVLLTYFFKVADTGKLLHILLNFHFHRENVPSQLFTRAPTAGQQCTIKAHSSNFQNYTLRSFEFT